jgi:NAD(P)-dependent dehydrogenase (short-subunit alcohol dehydrogenase family)
VADRDALPGPWSKSARPSATRHPRHAAGINTREAADDVTPEGWDATLASTSPRPSSWRRHMVPAMRKERVGPDRQFRLAADLPRLPGGISYGASKGGVAQLTRAMAEAWSPAGITANAIGPGFFPTELTAAVFDDPERAARNAAQTCIGRNGAPEDLDGPLLFLCSEASATSPARS